MVAIYSGTFDPVTNGHMDIIERGCAIAEKLIIAISKNRRKNTLFTIEERVKHLEVLTAGKKNIQIVSFYGMMHDLFKDLQADCIIRGVRTGSDLDYEMQMTYFNKAFSNGHIETLMLPASPQWVHVSSSAVKEVLRYKGSVDAWVPAYIKDCLVEKEAMLNGFCDGTT